MSAYYDTGVLVSFYVEEKFSKAAAILIEDRQEAISLNAFHQLELENALLLKVFRGELDEQRCRAVREKVISNIGEGRLCVRPADWADAIQEARRISAKVTVRTGCRTLDLLHIAVALQWESVIFVTADNRQLRAARLMGLRAVDVRALPEHRAGDTPPPGRVREKRARYRTRR